MLNFQKMTVFQFPKHYRLSNRSGSDPDTPMRMIDYDGRVYSGPAFGFSKRMLVNPDDWRKRVQPLSATKLKTIIYGSINCISGAIIMSLNSGKIMKVFRSPAYGRPKTLGCASAFADS